MKIDLAFRSYGMRTVRYTATVVHNTVVDGIYGRIPVVHSPDVLAGGAVGGALTDIWEWTGAYRV